MLKRVTKSNEKPETFWRFQMAILSTLSVMAFILSILLNSYKSSWLGMFLFWRHYAEKLIDGIG